MKLSEMSISRPVLATMMSLGLVLFGFIGIARLPVRELPDIDPPIVNVTTVYQGASAAVIETQITEPIEEALTSVEGIRTLSSESREQVSSITVEFDLSRPIEVAAQDVRDRVSRIRGKLPDNIEEPIVAKQDADAQPILWVALYSDRFSTLELSSMAENVFKDRLQTINGVSSVIFGGQKRFAIRLWLDSQKMAAREVTVLDVQKALKEQNVELPSGLVESWSRALSIETRGELKTPEEYNNLVIKRNGSAFIRLSDIGHASIGVEDERSVARFNSRPAVGIGIIKQSKANTIDVAQKIKAELARIKESLPEDVYTSIPYDESIFVEKSIHEVWETLGLAFLLVVLTIFAFLHNFRSTLVPSVSIPVSIIATFGMLYVMGYSINTVTMLAFVLAIGLVVDDSIIVLENIYRHIEDGMKPLDAAYKGMSEIGFVVIATTIALVAVFFPMAFQTSVTGRLFVEFAFALCFSVIISAFVALTLAPMASSKFLKPHDPNEKLGILGFFEKWLKNTTAKYERSLGWTLKHPIIVVPIFIGSILLSVFFYTQLDHEFLPTEDKGRLLCIAIAPEGSTSEYTDRMVRKMEEIIAATPEVEGYFSAVALSRGSPGKSSQGLAFLRLKEKRTRHIRDIVGGPTGLAGQFFGKVEGAFVIPIIPQAIGRGFSQPFQLVLQGQDLDSLNKYSAHLSDKLRASGLLMNVRSNFEINKPELRVHINRDRAAALGITVEDISKTLQILFGGLDLSKVNIGGKQYDVIVQLERESRLSPSDLDKLYIPNADGKLIQLSNVVTYDTGAGPSAINHYNRYRSATIEGTPVGVPLGTIIDQVKAIIREDEVPEGIRYEWSGEARDLIESSSQIYFVMILAAIVIYMVLASQFESLVHPLTIMLTLPLAAFGAFGALWVLNWADKLSMILSFIPGNHWYSHVLPRIPSMGINLFSQIGMILLFGLVTKNGILLVDFANHQMAKGKTPTEAMLAAGVIRLRPILMTACATIAGILPIAIGFGAGAESRRPLGVAAVGGMLTSTFLTLFVIPVVYVVFSKLQKSKAAHKAVKSTVTVLVLCVFFSGCTTVGPNYQRPQEASVSKWKNKDYEHAKTQFPENSNWWTLLGDDVLNELEIKALANNQDLRSAVAAVDKARALARIAESDFQPQVDFNPSIERSRTTKNAVSSSSSFSGRSLTTTRYNVPLDLSYEIDIWGKVRRSFEAGRAEAQASEEAFHTVQLTLTADVAQQYLVLRELDAEVETLVQTIELRQRASDVVRNRVQGGVSSELDLSRATTELAQAKADIIDVRRRRGEVENRLALLCGVPASEFKIEPASLKVNIPKIPAGLPSELLKRRPDIAEAERTLASTSARIGVAQAEMFPSISLNGSAGFESVDADTLLDWESRVGSLGPSVNLPIFNGGRNKAKLKAARADFAMALAKYNQQILIAFQETEDALNNITLRHEQMEAQDQLVKATSVSSKLSITRYRQGLVSFLEVVDAERTRLQSELEAIQIKTEEIIATIRLIKALGGAW